MGAAEGASVVGATPLARSGAANVPGTSGAACRAWTRTRKVGEHERLESAVSVLLDSESQQDVGLEPAVLLDSVPAHDLLDAWLDGGPGGSVTRLLVDQAVPLELAGLPDSGPDQDARLEYDVLLGSGGSVARALVRAAGYWAGSESGSAESSAWVCAFVRTWRELICRS